MWLTMSASWMEDDEKTWAAGGLCGERGVD
jgi:hypothetical protein